MEYGVNLTLDKYGGSEAGQKLDQSLLNAKANIPLMKSDAGMFSMDIDQLAGPMYDALRASGRKNLPDPETIVDLSILEDVQGA
jgi:hypothetical protein